MTISVPLVAVLGAVAFVAYRYMGLRLWHAAVTLLFGFFLAATSAAPQIRSLVASILALFSPAPPHR